ncbi:hypothetical protein [Methylobacterium sp. sgz302541]|uniref:hypothetical protein n=1 Tax=unclassified Methylobacterium TaxID=2615210 RepID=UPI003D32C57D
MDHAGRPESRRRLREEGRHALPVRGGEATTFDIVCEGRSPCVASARFVPAGARFQGRIAMRMGGKTMTMTGGAVRPPQGRSRRRIALLTPLASRKQKGECGRIRINFATLL